MNVTTEKVTTYETLIMQLNALLENEQDLIANMANTAALLYHSIPNINWAGFYLYKQQELILGPFQGNVACMHIPMGKGVCGNSAASRQALVVKNVHEFPGHIACDYASKSEIVVPIIKENTLLGVLDIDSPVYDRFDEEDLYYMKKVVEILCQSL